MMARRSIFIFIFILISGPSPRLQAGELPKDLRVAEEMIRDGLARDAVIRIRGWLQKNSSTPQPEAQVLLAEALLADSRPTEALAALPKTPPAELTQRVLLVQASALNEAQRWKEALVDWKRLNLSALPQAQANQARLGLASALLNENQREEGQKELRQLMEKADSPTAEAARILMVKTLLAEGRQDDAEKELATIKPDAPPSARVEARYWKAEITAARGKVRRLASFSRICWRRQMGRGATCSPAPGLPSGGLIVPAENRPTLRHPSRRLWTGEVIRKPIWRPPGNISPRPKRPSPCRRLPPPP